mgnify:CR=1 FL=1
MTTNVAVTAIRKFCKAKGWKIKGPVRHLHTMAYVVGYAASKCLIVACPWPQSEKHMREWDRLHPLNPTFREWLMGWPIDWTAKRPLETDRFREWLRGHGRR